MRGPGPPAHSRAMNNTMNPEATTTESGPDTRPVPERALLRRSYADRMLGGVAGGLARYFGVDTMVVRIAFVVLTLVGGAGIPLYLAGLLLIPDEGSDQSIAGSSSNPSSPDPGKELRQCLRSVITLSPAIPGLASPGPAASRRCSAACPPTSTCASRTPSARR